jgi:hypothetical protein
MRSAVDESQRSLMRPLPLWERAARRFNERGWVRGQSLTPHPAVYADTLATPSPTVRAFTPLFDGLWGEGKNGWRRIRYELE